MPLRFPDSFNFSKKRILLRVDFNVDFNRRGEIIDDFRIKRTLPAIDSLLRNKARAVVLISHFGRPKPRDKKRDKNKPEFSLERVFRYLKRTLKNKVYFLKVEIGKPARKEINKLPFGSVVLLENIRFYKGEEKNDKSFAKQLASLGDIYINEAFSVSHRFNASLCAVTKFLPSFGGMLLNEELENLDKLMKKPKKPLVIILGGAKIEDKLPLIEKFLEIADYILIGGGIANTILKAWGFEIGSSFYSQTMVRVAKNLGSKKAELVLPGDLRVLTRGRKKELRELGEVNKNEKILDIGPLTGYTYNQIISKAKTIFWNGPMGKIEENKFSKGTEDVFKAILKNKNAFSVIGGGETIASLKIKNKKLKIKNKNIFLSTGGGAMLNYLAGEKMPALKALI